MSNPTERTRRQRLLDAVLHRGPGYDLTPTPSVPEAEHATLERMTREQRLVDAHQATIGQLRAAEARRFAEDMDRAKTQGPDGGPTP